MRARRRLADRPRLVELRAEQAATVMSVAKVSVGSVLQSGQQFMTLVPLDAPLDAPRMAALVDGLFATRNPYVTPAGLPVLIRYSLDEIRRRFGLKGDEG